MQKLRWGVLSTAKIARERFIPAIAKSELGEVVAIASRTEDKAETVAKSLHIPRYYSSYEEMLEAPDIDAIYNPLPNDMHVPWTMRAVDKGKHVLCEKPIGLDAHEATHLSNHVKNRNGIKVMEAFMYRFHPQWDRILTTINEGTIGEVTLVQSHFTYFKDDPQNIRSDPEKGGGGLMDIGVYCTSTSRWIYGKEPIRVQAQLRMHPQWNVDILANGIMDFGEGKYASFTCGTQTFGDQYVNIYGTKGKIVVPRPFNAMEKTIIEVHLDKEVHEIPIEETDQYTLQADAFAQAVFGDTEVPTPLTDAVANMRVIEALKESAEMQRMVKIADSR